MTNTHNKSKPAPQVLYKYLPAVRALEVIPEGGNGALRATQPATLNDPLECATNCIAVYPSTDEETQDILKSLNFVAPKHPLTDSDVQHTLKQLGTQAWNDLFRKQLSRRFGVISFSISPLHPLLWAHYADSGAGVVIGYRTSILENIATGTERLGAVRYYEKPPISAGHVIFTDEGNLHVILLSKARYWEYEQEWRLTLELKNTVGTGKNDRNGHSINLCPIPNEAVTEVYYTERTPKSHVDKIAARLNNPNNRFGVDAPKKVVLAYEEYGYEIT